MRVCCWAVGAEATSWGLMRGYEGETEYIACEDEIVRHHKCNSSETMRHLVSTWAHYERRRQKIFSVVHNTLRFEVRTAQSVLIRSLDSGAARLGL